MTAVAGQEPDYSFARRPKWIVSHVLVLALVVAMIAAGFWQIDRHVSRGDRNDLIEARVDLDPVALGSVVSPDAEPSIGETEQFRRVEVVGEYRVEDEVLIRNRTLDGAPGWWVLTPLVTEEGWAVAVNRGWIPRVYEAGEARPGTEAPSGTVQVTGWIQPARVAEGFQVADPNEGRLTNLGRPDVARLAQQLDYVLSPVVLRVDPVNVPGQDFPKPIPLPALDAGPHASYAVQWFVFTAIALLGYPLVLRRVARGKASSAPEFDDDEEYLSL